MGTKAYFFSGNAYVRYDRGDDRADEGYPLPIAGNWRGLAEAGLGDHVGAAVNWENGKLYLFRSDQYVRYDVAADRVDDGYPLRIADHWPALARVGFASDLNASINWGDGKAYFFKGAQYVRYDISGERVDDGYPLPIAGYWPGLGEVGFGDQLDGAINWGNGKAYFFKGAQYVRYDVPGNRVDDGYPLPIAGYWPGLLAEVRAPVDLVNLHAELWVPSATVVRSPVNGPRYLPLPWRGVLHSTEGFTVEDAIGTFQRTNFWPHFTIDPKTFRVVQHLPLGIGARALSDHATQENAARCIQIEIVGRAAESLGWPPEHLAFMREVMREIENLVPIPRVSGRRLLDAHGVNTTPGNRMSIDEWRRFSGWCGHQHVPGESHWDPGALDIEAMLAG